MPEPRGVVAAAGQSFPVGRISKATNRSLVAVQTLLHPGVWRRLSGWMLPPVNPTARWDPAGGYGNPHDAVGQRSVIFAGLPALLGEVPDPNLMLRRQNNRFVVPSIARPVIHWRFSWRWTQSFAFQSRNAERAIEVGNAERLARRVKFRRPT